MRDDEAIAIAQRLEVIGVEVRSQSLRESAEEHARWRQNGNRALRRQNARAARKRGRGVTRA
jgi:hypothetical protein